MDPTDDLSTPNGVLTALLHRERRYLMSAATRAFGEDCASLDEDWTILAVTDRDSFHARVSWDSPRKFRIALSVRGLELLGHVVNLFASQIYYGEAGFVRVADAGLVGHAQEDLRSLLENFNAAASGTKQPPEYVPHDDYKRNVAARTSVLAFRFVLAHELAHALIEYSQEARGIHTYSQGVAKDVLASLLEHESASRLFGLPTKQIENDLRNRIRAAWGDELAADHVAMRLMISVQEDTEEETLRSILHSRTAVQIIFFLVDTLEGTRAIPPVSPRMSFSPTHPPSVMRFELLERNFEALRMVPYAAELTDIINSIGDSLFGRSAFS